MGRDNDRTKEIQSERNNGRNKEIHR